MNAFWKATRWARAIRFWIFVVLALGAYLGFGGDAHAQTFLCDGTDDGCDEGSARSSSIAERDRKLAAYCAAVTGTCTSTALATTKDGAGAGTYYSVGNPVLNGSTQAQVNAVTWYVKGCNTRPPVASALINRTLSPGLICREGCRYTLIATESGKLQTGLGAVNYARGSLSPNGAVCGSTGDTPGPGQNEVCTENGGGYQTCKRSDTKTCIVSPSGKSFCYNPNETGPKTSNDRTEGSSKSTAPATPTPPTNRDGEDFDPTTNSSDTNNITNVTNNFGGYGNNGTPNLNPDDAEPGDGSGTGEDGDGGDGDGDGDGDGEDDGTSTGGAGCEAPPVSAGGDPLLRMQIEQTWRVRCPHGENPLPSPGGAGDQGSDPHPAVGDVVKDGSGILGAIAAGGDDSGFGMPSSCPLLDIPVFVLRGQTVDMPWPVVCSWLEIMAALVLIAGHVQFAFIVATLGAK